MRPARDLHHLLVTERGDRGRSKALVRASVTQLGVTVVTPTVQVTRSFGERDKLERSAWSRVSVTHRKYLFLFNPAASRGMCLLILEV